MSDATPVPLRTRPKKKTWGDKWGKEHNKRRSERYHADPEYREKVRSEARSRRRAADSSSRGGITEQKDCSDSLAAFSRLGTLRTVHLPRGDADRQTFTTEELAEALHYNPQVLYRWFKKGQLPAPEVQTDVVTGSFGRQDGSHPMKVYLGDEAKAILEVLVEHQTKFRYFRKDHAETIEAIEEAVASVRKEYGIA